MDLFYFLLLTSSLIFVHESGHFALAKLFGVKVLTFSVGFGPKVLRFRGKETEYCLGLFPFGGFVQMLESSRAQKPIPPEELPRTYEAQATWKRFLIILAGPAMNLVFPIAIYTSVYLEEREMLSPVVGTVAAGRPSDGLLFPGDRVIAVEGREVETFPEVQRLIGERAGHSVPLLVEREGTELEVRVTPEAENETRGAGIIEAVGRIGIGAHFSLPVIGVSRPDSPAYRAGLRTFDRIVLVNGQRIERLVELVSLLSKNRGEALLITYLRPRPLSTATNGLSEIALFDTAMATLSPKERPADATRPETYAGRYADMVERNGIESADAFIAYVPEQSSEWKAGLRPGDRVTDLDGKPLGSFGDLRSRLLKEPTTPHDLRWTRLGEPMGGVFQLQREAWEDEFAQAYTRYVFRTTHDLPHAKDVMVATPHRFFHAVARGFEESLSVTRFVAIGILRVLSGKISLSTVTGPITILDIAGEAGARGATYFLWAMAVISVNLGLVNLLPIPVLDGGQVVFLLVEAVRRRPLALRTRQMASLLGMTLLGALTVIAFKNDVDRRLPFLLGEIKELFG